MLRAFVWKGSRVVVVVGIYQLAVGPVGIRKGVGVVAGPWRMEAGADLSHGVLAPAARAGWARTNGARGRTGRVDRGDIERAPHRQSVALRARVVPVAVVHVHTVGVPQRHSCVVDVGVVVLMRQ